MSVKPKKHLGQHFLKNNEIALRITESFSVSEPKKVVEVGPGTGVLTKFLTEKDFDLHVVEIDTESVEYLEKNFPKLNGRIISGDFLKLDLQKTFSEEIIVVGNFPYNISSQILFKVLENKELIPQMVGMFQKEVAERVVSKEGSKVYGILSVLIQAFYEAEYLFTVEASEFYPPPKVQSGVIKLTRKPELKLNCNEKLFKQIVKQSFNQRRKMIGNSLKSFFNEKKIEHKFMNKRPEQLSWEQFVELTNIISNSII